MHRAKNDKDLILLDRLFTWWRCFAWAEKCYDNNATIVCAPSLVPYKSTIPVMDLPAVDAERFIHSPNIV